MRKKLFFNNLLSPKGKNQKSEQNRMAREFCFLLFSTFQPLNQKLPCFKLFYVTHYRPICTNSDGFFVYYGSVLKLAGV